MGGITDKVTGLVKQVAGDLTNAGALRREGLNEERKRDVKDELANADKQAHNPQQRPQRSPIWSARPRRAQR